MPPISTSLFRPPAALIPPPEPEPEPEPAQAGVHAKPATPTEASPADAPQLLQLLDEMLDHPFITKTNTEKEGSDMAFGCVRCCGSQTAAHTRLAAPPQVHAVPQSASLEIPVRAHPAQYSPNNTIALTERVGDTFDCPFISARPRHCGAGPERADPRRPCTTAHACCRSLSHAPQWVNSQFSELSRRPAAGRCARRWRRATTPWTAWLP